jgi:hypothetical protein
MSVAILLTLFFLFPLSKIQQHIPFSVIGSDSTAVIGNRRVRCRTYRWGVVEGKTKNGTSGRGVTIPEKTLFRGNDKDVRGTID